MSQSTSLLFSRGLADDKVTPSTGAGSTEYTLHSTPYLVGGKSVLFVFILFGPSTIRLLCYFPPPYETMKSAEISDVARTGFAAADAYDAHRPSYPAEAVEQFLRGLEIAGVRAAKVADLAAGTGKFTEILAARPEEYDIVAIEPHDGMRAQLEQKHLPRVRVVRGTADDMSDIPDGSLAAVVAAQVSSK